MTLLKAQDLAVPPTHFCEPVSPSVTRGPRSLEGLSWRAEGTALGRQQWEDDDGDDGETEAQEG